MEFWWEITVDRYGIFLAVSILIRYRYKFRESVREKFFCGEVAEVSNLILIGFILRILTTEHCL